MRKHFAILYGLADHTVQGLDRVGGVDYLADIFGVMEQGDQVRPVALPTLADGWIFLVPDFGKGRRFLFGLLDRQRTVDLFQVCGHPLSL